MGTSAEDGHPPSDLVLVAVFVIQGLFSLAIAVAAFTGDDAPVGALSAVVAAVSFALAIGLHDGSERARRIAFVAAILGLLASIGRLAAGYLDLGLLLWPFVLIRLRRLRTA